MLYVILILMMRLWNCVQKTTILKLNWKRALISQKKLIEGFFKELSLKGKKIEIFQAATQDNIDTCKNILLNNFDENILTVSLRADFPKSKYPKLHEFYMKHWSAEPIISTCSNNVSSTLLGTNHLDMEKFHLLENLYQKKRLMAQQLKYKDLILQKSYFRPN